MPACASESLSRLWQTGSRDSVRADVDSPCESASLSPTSTSPPNTSPIATLRRARSVSPTTTFLKQESFKIKSKWRSTQALVSHKDRKPILATVIGWYPCFLLQVLRAVVTMLLPIALFQTLLSLPRMWFSVWLWAFWQVIEIPLGIIKWILTLINTPVLEFLRKKRTVLISGGSSVQALHLARNFYSAGARVVVCEIEGEFELARFSTAVSRFYTLPRPSTENTRAYVQRLCAIVEKENAAYYVPVNTTTSAYYDALAKPMLELLGCTCICPGTKEVLLLDDPLQFLSKCEDMSLATPVYLPVESKSELRTLYGEDSLLDGKHVVHSCGPLGSRDHLQAVLPESVAELGSLPEVVVDGSRPWVVVRDEPGDHYVTCTTVKQSQVVANVSCRMGDNKCLVPVEQPHIEQWVRTFFERLKSARPLAGHFSFTLCVTASGAVVPLGCRVTVPLAYICHTSVHARLLWRPCKHFSRQHSGPLVVKRGRYMLPPTVLGAVLGTVQKPGVGAVSSLIGTVHQKREALFALWDPLPYCAYYHLQLPFRHITRFLHPQTISAH